MEEEFVERHSKDVIKEEVCEWAFNNIGERFKFREYQLDTIIDIVYNILNDINHTQIIEAPTGSGKSLVNIISAGVLADCYDKESYILCSDLYLWKQYNDFISKHPKIKKKFGVLKGQTGNYTCQLNGEDMRNSDCRMAGIAWASLFNPSSAEKLGYECAATCQYVKERKKALRSKVVLMTYALYHYMINIVSKSATSKGFIFSQRDTIFCDECHNIPSIVSGNFSPTVTLSQLDNFQILRKYAVKTTTNSMDLFGELDTEGEKIDFGVVSEYTENNLTEKFLSIFNIMCDDKVDSKSNFKAIQDYLNMFKEFAPVVEYAESMLAYKKQVSKGAFTKEDRELYKACSWFRNINCIWNDFGMAIEETGPEYVIKTVSEDRKDFHLTVEFRCVKEDYICYKFLLNTAQNRVLMTATLGGEDAFNENIGTKYFNEEPEFVRVPSTFNFEQSPIYFLNRYKMSYANKDMSFPKLKNIIYKICTEKFEDDRGMIQTGSYANAKEIYDSAPPDIKARMLLYNDPKEKTSMITMHQMSRNTILIGPTLVEGIDLPNDQCRFIIIMKVPYPVIIDKYVKRKNELFPLWYNSTTSNTIIQGIGRGVRNEKDYCSTYILDACFLNLYNVTKDQYPEELQNRIQIFK